MLNVISLEDAKKIVSKFSLDTSEELVNLSDACDRICSQDVLSSENLPPFDRSTMDGFALCASDTFGAGSAIPAMLTVKGEVAMGKPSLLTTNGGECVKIPTGGMLPQGANAVIPIEYTEAGIDGFCYVFKSVAPFENVTKTGDDIKKGSVILSAGEIITPAAIASIAAAGINQITVKRKIQIGIISTGDELVPHTSEIQNGEIRDINSVMLSALLRKNGADTKAYGIIPDDYAALESAVKIATSENDTVIISGGSSAGEKDNTHPVIAALGEVFCHGIAIKPGKPTIIGQIEGKPVFGLPGHPAAAYFTANELIVPLISKKTVQRKNARLISNISSNNGRTEFVCVKFTENGVKPVLAKSGIISALAQSDGYIIIDRNTEGLAAGTKVEVFEF